MLYWGPFLKHPENGVGHLMRFTQRRIPNPVTHWESSENTNCVLRRCNVSTLYSLFSWFGFALWRVVLPPCQTRKRWGRGEGKNWGREKIPPAFNPMGCLKLRSPADRARVFLIYRQNVNQANFSKVRVPVQTCEYTFHQQGHLELREWNNELTLSLAFMFTQV